MLKSNQKLTPRSHKAIIAKRKIFDTAMHLFVERGYDNVTVDDIVSAAATSKGAFYNHFVSKDQIVLENFKQFDKYYEKNRKSIFEQATCQKKLLKLLQLQHQYCIDLIGLDSLKIVYANQISLTPNKEKFFIDESRGLFTFTKEIIEEGQRAKEFREDITAHELAHFLTSLMRGFIYNWCLFDGKFNMLEEGQKHFNLILECIKKKTTCNESTDKK